MVMLIPDSPKSAAIGANDSPPTIDRSFEAVAMTAFIVAMFLFVEVAPAFVN